MAKNTGRGAQTDRAEPPPREQHANGALWKRNSVSGRFTDAKRTGGAFKGTRRTG